MNCEEFATLGLGAEHDSEFGTPRHAEAMEHLANCVHCAALAESWEAAREKLQLLTEVTNTHGAPARVEMRLRQEFRTRHRTMKTRRAAVVVSWTLAAAAVLVGAVSLVNWRAHHVVHVVKDVAANSQNGD